MTHSRAGKSGSSRNLAVQGIQHGASWETYEPGRARIRRYGELTGFDPQRQLEAAPRSAFADHGPQRARQDANGLQRLAERLAVGREIQI